ncbi:hypothetical protein [Sulfobacillus harzensis]|uniref:Uncharacterized protein n=1 Tax=Sulfobacillus harzensis TaxID=2729629 RepID=A0A7Y0L670_9FIRM|nr:hypothetical protein [Sulfobacillus harzensis]NMP23965.1 hypothetical protein [Sulfobacillus harzensis]
MKFPLMMLWAAAGLSVIGAGATFAEVHLQSQVATKLSAIHQELQIAGGTTQTLNQQLTLLGAVNNASAGLSAGLSQTVNGTQSIQGGLGTLNETVASINQKVHTITDNTNQAANNLHAGLAPQTTVNGELSQVARANDAILTNLSELLALNQQLNRVLEETNSKLP